MTTIRLISDELMVMPNSVLFKNPVEVLTSQNKRRVTLIRGVAYSEDVEQAVQGIQNAIKNCDSIKKDEENYCGRSAERSDWACLCISAVAVR